MVRRTLGSKIYVFWAAIVGNILEYYDFTVYIVFSMEIGKTFFPADAGFSQVLPALLVFAFGFIGRPIGGVILGYIGDRFGRKSALFASALGMTLATLGIGMLPGYSSIGYFSIFFLCIFRLVQGFCISGEGTGAAIFILEHSKIQRPGLMSGIVHSTNIVGTLLATFVALGFRYFYPDIGYAWRIAFVLGGVFGIFALILRWQVSETPIFAKMRLQRGAKRDDIATVIKGSAHKMFLTFAVGSFASSIVQLIKGYVNVYYQDVLGLSQEISLHYLMYAAVVLMISMIVFGYLVDKIGKEKILIASGIMAVILPVPALYFMAGSTIFHHLIAITLLDIIGGAASASAYAFVISLFEPSQRFFGVSVSYNLGIAIFGGTAPAIARYMVDIFGYHYAPGFYIAFIASLFLIVMLKTRPMLSK